MKSPTSSSPPLYLFLFLSRLFLFSNKIVAALSSWRQLQQSNNKYHLLLELTFDDNPSQLSWKFENARTKTLLAGVPFASYDKSMSGMSIKIPLEFMTEKDLSGDPYISGQSRDYRFIIYDMGSDGLCCQYGQGSYKLYSLGNLIAKGADFGVVEEHFFFVDPADFQVNDAGVTSPTQQKAPAPTSMVALSGAVTGTGGNETREEISTSLSPALSPDPSMSFKPTTFSQRTISPKPSNHPISLIAQEILDQTAWFCGKNWNVLSPKCDNHVPCPDGDASVCPEGEGCYASTPCTLAPTETPTVSPSEVPSAIPSMEPTRAPWSHSEFLDFLNGDAVVASGEPQKQEGSNNQGGGGDGSLKGELQPMSTLLSTTDENVLQYHFFCGYNFNHADTTCGQFCPTGDKNVCPDGMQCFANTQCDGRDTPAPSSIAPTPSPGSGVSPSSSICTLCGKMGLHDEKSVTFEGNPSTCGKVSEVVSQFNADACTTAQAQYQDECCYDGCQLCQTMEGDFLDIKRDHVVTKGDYTATCDEIQNLLTTFATNEEICSKSQSQLAEECCYDQCSLCDDSETTKWNSIVQFENVTTTCLGLDYVLRREQTLSGSEKCTDLQEQYSSQCCRNATKVEPCQLCKADNGNVYNVNELTLQQFRSTTTCSAMAAAMVVMESSDISCSSAREKYFDPCCNMTDAQHIVHDTDTVDTSNSPDSSNSTADLAWDSGPTNFVWNPKSSEAEFTSFTKPTLGVLAVVFGYFIML